MSNPTVKMWSKRITALKNSVTASMSRPHRLSGHFDRYSDKRELTPWLKALKMIFLNGPVFILFWPFMAMISMVREAGGFARMDGVEWVLTILLGMLMLTLQVMLIGLVTLGIATNTSPSVDQLNREMSTSPGLHDKITSSLQTRTDAISHRDLSNFRASCAPVVIPSNLTEQKKALLK